MKPSIYDTCIRITADFEGTGYDSVSGNFDGMGLSCGLLQWNLGQGTLQNYILNHCNLLTHNFPVNIDHLQKITPSEAVIFAKDVMHDSRGKLKPEWAIAWKMFMTSPAVINLQKRAVDKYYHRAREICGKLGFPHENTRAMAFSFDVAVQNWSFNVDRPQANIEQSNNILELYDAKNFALWHEERLTDDQRILIIAAHLRAIQCKKEWRHAVFVRKATIAIGLGYVNGSLHDYRVILKD